MNCYLLFKFFLFNCVFAEQIKIFSIRLLNPENGDRNNKISIIIETEKQNADKIKIWNKMENPMFSIQSEKTFSQQESNLLSSREEEVEKKESGNSKNSSRTFFSESNRSLSNSIERLNNGVY